MARVRRIVGLWAAATVITSGVRRPGRRPAHRANRGESTRPFHSALCGSGSAFASVAAATTSRLSLAALITSARSAIAVRRARSGPRSRSGPRCTRSRSRRPAPRSHSRSCSYGCKIAVSSPSSTRSYESSVATARHATRGRRPARVIPAVHCSAGRLGRLRRVRRAAACLARPTTCCHSRRSSGSR